MGGMFNVLIPELRVGLGGLTLGLFFLMSWLTLSWWNTHKKIFYLLVTILLLFAGVVTLLLAYRYQTGWVADLCFSLMIIGSTWVVWRIQPMLRKNILQGVLVTLMCTLIFPLLLIKVTQNQSYIALRANVDSVHTTLTSAEAALVNQVQNIATDPTIQTITKSGVTPELSVSLQHLFLSKSLQALTIVDTSGHVITRSQNSSFHDSILATYPWFVTVLRGDTINGVTYAESGGPLIIAAMPITDQGVQIGSLLIGQDIHQLLIAKNSNLALAVATSSGITSFTARNDVEIKLFNAAVLNEAIRTNLAQNITQPSSFEFHLALDGVEYRTVGMAEDTLGAGQPLAYVTIDSEQANRTSPVGIGILLGIGGLLGALSLELMKKWKKS